VRRIAWSQLRFRTARSVALLLGMVFAVTSFTVLTAASRTAQLRTTGTVTAHFGSAYQILVRPKGARTLLEVKTGTVQPNFLSGIYGGISLAQYHAISGILGVSVAAPIAMIGYTLENVSVPIRLPASAAAYPGARSLYRVSTTWVSAAGKTRISQPPSYVYLTRDRLGLATSSGATYETTPSGSRTVCLNGFQRTGPFTASAQTLNWCWSKVNGQPNGLESVSSLTASHPGFTVNWQFPMLVAAIDPDTEAKLDGFSRALTSGHYLGERQGAGTEANGGSSQVTVPVLAASSSGIGEYATTQVQRLTAPASPPLENLAWMAAEGAAGGQTVQTTDTQAQQAYKRLLGALGGTYGTAGSSYWTVGPTSYRSNGDGSLTPVSVRNPPSVWKTADIGYVTAPMDNADNQYRAIHAHPLTSSSFSGPFPVPQPRLVGVFDPGKVGAFDPLSGIPLGPYQATAAAPADPASRAALHGGDLAPSMNLGGYISQPPQLITTLAALPAWENSPYFHGVNARAPISVIRVRVAGVSGPGPVSLERIRQVAQQIKVRTGLDVDIVAGASPAPTTITLPAGRFGQPPLRLTEGWVKLGVAVAILTAVDKKSVVLFTLILIVCALFVANSAAAAVRSRRRELGVLACLGWNRSRLFTVVLGELAWIGLAAGVVGGLLSLPTAAALGLHGSLIRAALAVPAAVGLAVLAGAVPAWLAARADPVACVRPPVAAVRRAHSPAGITGLAVVNVLRTPGRTLIGALSLAVGTTALTLIVSIVLAFRGTLVGSLLGDAVAVQIRGPDYVAAVATVILGVLTVTDVLFVNIRERAAELATMRAFGWTERALSRLVITEGALIGAVGSCAGVAIGLAGAAGFAGQIPGELLLAALITVAAGIAVTVAGAVAPARLLRRLPTAPVLAEE
jgi:hypothetical protein